MCYIFPVDIMVLHEGKLNKSIIFSCDPIELSWICQTCTCKTKLYWLLSLIFHCIIRIFSNLFVEIIPYLLLRTSWWKYTFTIGWEKDNKVEIRQIGSYTFILSHMDDLTFHFYTWWYWLSCIKYTFIVFLGYNDKWWKWRPWISYGEQGWIHNFISFIRTHKDMFVLFLTTWVIDCYTQCNILSDYGIRERRKKITRKLKQQVSQNKYNIYRKIK